MDIFSASSADSLLVYLPEDVKRKIEAELPKIEKDIERKVETFVAELSRHLDQEVFKVVRDREGELAKLEAELASKIGELSSTQAATQVLSSAKELQGAVQRYKEQWTSIGAKTRTIALGILKSAGVPIPDIS